MYWRTSIRSPCGVSTTPGRLTMRCTPRIPTSGKLMIGVARMPPMLPALVIEKVLPLQLLAP